MRILGGLWARSNFRRSAAIVLFVVCLSCIRTSAQNASLPNAWQRKVFDSAFSVDLSFPKIENGYLISFQRALEDPTVDHAIDLESLATAADYPVPIWFDRASVVWIADASVMRNNEVFVAGSLLRPGSSDVRHFLSKFDFAGHLLNAADLGEYEPELMCAARDGSLWLLGQVWSAEESRTSYQMLRNYSVDGRLLRSALNREDVHGQINLSDRLHHADGRPGRAILACADNFVGAYIGPTIKWVQVDLSSGAERSWIVPTPAARAKITGLAVLGERVYASFVTSSDDVNRQMGLYRLSLSSPLHASHAQEGSFSQHPNRGGESSWEAIPGTVSPATTAQSFLMLIGSDSSSLVYLRHKPLGAPQVFWSKEPN